MQIRQECADLKASVQPKILHKSALFLHKILKAFLGRCHNPSPDLTPTPQPLLFQISGSATN